MSYKTFLKDASHRHVWLYSAIIFAFLVVVLGGPLVFRAYADISSAHQEAIQTNNAKKVQAIVDRNYESWASLETDPILKREVNAGNFNAFAEAYTLLERGKIAEADVVKRQLNLKQEYQIVATKSLEISSAIVNQDYEKWRSIVGPYESPQIDASNFERYASAISYVKEGKVNKAFSTLRSLNLKQGTNASSSR